MFEEGQKVRLNEAGLAQIKAAAYKVASYTGSLVLLLVKAGEEGFIRKQSSEKDLWECTFKYATILVNKESVETIGGGGW